MKTAALLAFAASLAFAQTAPKDGRKPAPVKAEPARPEVAKGTIKPGDPTPGGFLGNRDSKTYHRADCKTAAKMKAANRAPFASKAEAEKAGFKACKVCKP